MLNVVIQRTVEGGGHTPRYHNPLGEPILCTFTTDVWGPRFVDADLDAWYFPIGIDDVLLHLPFTWMLEQ